ncbi:uncharacterized protein K444DRAFT_168615 [Hyaloscypha bicolor E]|uniref:Uncharacterized protein n=1 Tax=Hyaloscypha bicolor E TaxID=1095630 RepID=A0A2J6TTE9_9HELO|nr:uncharacterized protein K444DRAFT_168615 [Hyaloscypha bicolor E]PMD66294.1 hypothetical protein K444DRAFT_168615 [Hyaloscypha bicolor E]
MHTSDPQESTYQSQSSAVLSRVPTRMQRLHLPSSDTLSSIRKPAVASRNVCLVFEELLLFQLPCVQRTHLVVVFSDCIKTEVPSSSFYAAGMRRASSPHY